MSVSTKGGNSITMTATNDAYTGVVWLAGLTMQLAGGTPGERLLIHDGASGAVIADYLVVDATADNVDLWGGRPPKYYQGLFLTTMPTGTGIVTFILA